MSEYCFNQNANGVYPQFAVTFTHPNAAAAAPAMNVHYFTTTATVGNPGEFKCLCSKCRCK